MQLRKDYVLDRWVIISEKRGARPKQFTTDHDANDTFPCFFCPGEEQQTPDEIGRIPHPEDETKWTARWFENKFPAVNVEENPNLDYSSLLFVKGGAFGTHEVVVETEDHMKQLWDLSELQLKTLFSVYQIRIKDLEKQECINYVQVFKNHGPKGGTSIIHSHTQVVGMTKVPTIVEQESTASIQDGRCLFCEVVHDESFSDRKILETENFISFCPYASRFNYESWIFPKQHIKKFTDLQEFHLLELAEHLKRILDKLKELNCSFNYFIHYAPEGKDLHMHMEIIPRIATWAGFEHGTGIIINSVSPESAAAFYRGELIVEYNNH